MNVSRRGFFGIIGAALVVPKPTPFSGEWAISNPAIHYSMHNELMTTEAFDKLLVGISRSYMQWQQASGYWADSIFSIVRKDV